MSLTYFGTDGIRGPYGSDTLNDAIAFRAGRAAVQVAKEKLGVEAPTIVVGRDTRASGMKLLQAFAKGVRAAGGDILDLGVAPTPCVAYAVRNSDAHLACSITASHNPARDNGIKFFQSEGVKPSEDLEQALDDAVGAASADGADGPDLEDLHFAAELKNAYEQAVIAFFPEGLLKGKRIALDCANGAMCEIAPNVFRALGAEVHVVASEPDGSNINDGVGSEHPESLRSLYSSGTYDLGFAFDGDGDRVIILDENGLRLPGEALLAALAIDAHERDELPQATLVTTIQSNLGLDAALRELGISVARTDVGDKHIARLMLAEGFSVGGEESGHLVLGGFAVTGDGLFAAVKLSEVVARNAKTIAELTRAYQAFPQSSKAFKVAAKPPLEECSTIAECMRDLERVLGKDGRLLVRYSGTEAKIRLLVEARDQETVDAAMTRLVASVEADLDLR